MPPVNPYDFSGYLKDQLEQSSGLMHGYNSELQSFRDQLDQTDRFAETGYSSVLGGSLLGAIGAALAGGDVGQIAGGAYGAGALSYNNLEKIEANKRKNLETQILNTQNLMKDQIDFSQQLIGNQGTYLSQMAQNFEKGDLPGSEPFNLKTSAEISKAESLYGARNPAADPAIQAQVEKLTGQKYQPGLPIDQLNLAKQTEEAQRRNDQWNRTVAEKVPYDAIVLPGAAPSTKDSQTAKDTIGTANKILSVNIPKLRDSLTQGAPIDQIVGDVKGMVEALKNLRKQGANFTQLEAELNYSQLPTALDTNPDAVVKYITDIYLRGQDPLRKLDRLAWTIEAETNAFLRPTGIQMRRPDALNAGGPTSQPISGGAGGTDINSQIAQTQAAINALKAQLGVK